MGVAALQYKSHSEPRARRAFLPADKRYVCGHSIQRIRLCADTGEGLMARKELQQARLEKSKADAHAKVEELKSKLRRAKAGAAA